MLKETETEETIVFFVTFLSLVAFQLGEGGSGPLATPMLAKFLRGKDLSKRKSKLSYYGNGKLAKAQIWCQS